MDIVDVEMENALLADVVEVPHIANVEVVVPQPPDPQPSVPQATASERIAFFWRGRGTGPLGNFVEAGQVGRFNARQRRLLARLESRFIEGRLEERGRRGFSSRVGRGGFSSRVGRWRFSSRGGRGGFSGRGGRRGDFSGRRDQNIIIYNSQITFQH